MMDYKSEQQLNIARLAKEYDLKMLRWEILDLVKHKNRSKVERLLQEMEEVRSGE